MKNTKFLVKVIRGTHAAEYVQRIDRSLVQTTPKRNLALVMGKLTAEDVVNSLGNSRCIPELVPVQVPVQVGESHYLDVERVRHFALVTPGECRARGNRQVKNRLYQPSAAFPERLKPSFWPPSLQPSSVGWLLTA